MTTNTTLAVNLDYSVLLKMLYTLQVVTNILPQSILDWEALFTMRSKELVNLFYKAGHVMSYRDVLRLYTDLGENTLKTMDENSAIVPPNLVRGRFVPFSTDNVDINEATLDATQVASWQRDPTTANLLDGIKLSTVRKLCIPDVMNDISPVKKRVIDECPFTKDNTAE